MADRDDAILAIKSYGSQYQPKFRHWLAYMGDGNGNVNTSQANYNLVRYPLSSSPAVEIFNVRAPAIDNLRVIVGYTAQQPNLLQVIDVADARLDKSSGDETVIVQPTYSYLPNHAANHMYLGVDPVLVNWRQITPLGVFPTSPPSLSVQIWGGYIPRPGADVYVSDQTIDLTSHVPGSGARYVLISYDSTGAPVATNGTINSGGFIALTSADIPNTPAGNWRSCAVVLYSGQVQIVETRNEIDFYDLRFPEETPALSQGHTIEDEGTPLTQRSKLNFVGAGVTASDDSGNNATVITILGTGHVIQDESTPLTQRANLNFTGTAVIATDDSGNSASKVTINYWSPLTNPEVPDLVFDSNGDVIMVEVTL